MPRVSIVSFFLFLFLGYPQPAVQAQVPSTFTVEATVYSESEEQPGTFSSEEGTFRGIGSLTFSERRMCIEFTGLLGVGTYAFSHHQYAITSLTQVSATEYAFEAVRLGGISPELLRGCSIPEGRRVTGRIQWTTFATGFSRIEYFELNEWGEGPTEGVDHRYSYPLSITATEMIERHPEIRFEGIIVSAP